MTKSVNINSRVTPEQREQYNALGGSSWLREKIKEGLTMQNEGVGPEEKDFIGEVIAEDNEARKVRTIGEQVKRVPRLSDDPAVRLAECRGEAVPFDEEAERALFETACPIPSVAYFDGEDYRIIGSRDIDGHENKWQGWLACAKSRAGVV